MGAGRESIPEEGWLALNPEQCGGDPQPVDGTQFPVSVLAPH